MTVAMTAVLQEPNGRKFVKYIKAPSDATGRALMTAELAITSGTLIGESIRTDVTPLDATNASASYSDAEFTFRNGANFTNVHFEQLANGYELPLSNGFIDIAKPEIVAWKNAWSAAHGGGYTLVHGKYVR